MNKLFFKKTISSLLCIIMCTGLLVYGETPNGVGGVDGGVSSNTVVVSSSPAFTISGASSITSNSARLQLTATYDTNDVTDDVLWRIVSGGDIAYINQDGYLYPLKNGSVVVGAEYTLSNGTTLSATHNISLSNQTPINKTYNVVISFSGYGYIESKTAEGVGQIWNGLTNSYPPGTEFVLTAKKANGGGDFMYWKDISGRIISTNPTYRFTVTSDISIDAVYRRSSSKKLVMFTNANKKILHSDYYAEGTTINAPTVPSIPGYQFREWKLGDVSQSFTNGQISADSLDGDKLFSAHHTPMAHEYTINVQGGSGSGKYVYNDEVCITLNEASVPENKYFAYWQKDGSPVSYNKTYSFRAHADANISAVYTDSETTERVPLITLSAPIVSADEKTITFTSERNLPLDYQLVETGIMLNVANAFNIANSDNKVKAISLDNVGQFCVRKKNVSEGTTWYAKAYIIYQKDGQVYTVYSDTQSGAL